MNWIIISICLFGATIVIPPHAVGHRAQDMSLRGALRDEAISNLLPAKDLRLLRFARNDAPRDFATNLPVTKLYLAQADGGGFSEVPDERNQGSNRKSPAKAFLMSLAIPGLGERYTGAHFKSKVFFLAEIGFWSSWLSFRHLGKWREDDYKLFAATEAGADVEGKDERYFDVIGFYDSREQYNKVGGVFDPSRTYYPDNQFYFWRWKSAESRQRYRDLKNDSKSYYRNADFSLGLIAVNHLLSAIDAYLSAKRYNRGISSGFSHFDLQLHADGARIGYTLRF